MANSIIASTWKTALNLIHCHPGQMLIAQRKSADGDAQYYGKLSNQLRVATFTEKLKACFSRRYRIHRDQEVAATLVNLSKSVAGWQSADYTTLFRVHGGAYIAARYLTLLTEQKLDIRQAEDATPGYVVNKSFSQKKDYPGISYQTKKAITKNHMLSIPAVTGAQYSQFIPPGQQPLTDFPARFRLTADSDFWELQATVLPNTAQRVYKKTGTNPPELAVFELEQLRPMPNNLFAQYADGSYQIWYYGDRPWSTEQKANFVRNTQTGYQMRSKYLHTLGQQAASLTEDDINEYWHQFTNSNNLRVKDLDEDQRQEYAQGLDFERLPRQYPFNHQAQGWQTAHFDPYGKIIPKNGNISFYNCACPYTYQIKKYVPETPASALAASASKESLTEETSLARSVSLVLPSNSSSNRVSEDFKLVKVPEAEPQNLLDSLLVPDSLPPGLLDAKSVPQVVQPQPLPEIYATEKEVVTTDDEHVYEDILQYQPQVLLPNESSTIKTELFNSGLLQQDNINKTISQEQEHIAILEKAITEVEEQMFEAIVAKKDVAEYEEQIASLLDKIEAAKENILNLTEVLSTH